MAVPVHMLLRTRSPRPSRVGVLWNLNGNLRWRKLVTPTHHVGRPRSLSSSCLTDTLETLDRSSRGQFLQRFFRSIAQIEITETQSLDLWDQALARKRELSESIGKRVALQAALVDVLASAGLLRLPIMMEYEELRKLQINAATDPLDQPL